jgi:hypothetical protein
MSAAVGDELATMGSSLMQGVVGVGTGAAGALFSGVFGLSSPEKMPRTPQPSPPTSKNGNYNNSLSSDAVTSLDDILASALSVDDDEINMLWTKSIKGLCLEDACIQLNSLAIAPSSIICLRDTIFSDNKSSIKSLSLISQVLLFAVLTSHVTIITKLVNACKGVRSMFDGL